MVVPLAGPHQLLQELHAGHQGMVKVKSLVHSFFWWPKLDADIEAVAGACGKCQQTQGIPPSISTHGVVHGLESTWITQVLLRTRCLGVNRCTHQMDGDVRMASASASAAIQQLRNTFAQFGLPHSVVTDNGSCFVTEDFHAFLKLNGLRHHTTQPQMGRLKVLYKISSSQ